MPIITIITLLVLGLMIWIVIRYNKRPTRFRPSGATTPRSRSSGRSCPVLILMGISLFFSFRLLFAYHDMPKPDLTVKATGYQWYWGYEYPDQKIAEFVSNMLPEDQAKAKASRALPLAADRADGGAGRQDGPRAGHRRRRDPRLRPAGLRPEDRRRPGPGERNLVPRRPHGTYYGQCSELCGVDHAFMPIEIHVVSQAEFDAWVASKGGSRRRRPRQPPGARAQVAAPTPQTAPMAAAARSPPPPRPRRPAGRGSAATPPAH
jgi:cytochrome c oxidase subunit 2